jgi:hypothetical protein
MSRQRLDVVIWTLSSVDAAETAALAAIGVVTCEDLSMITFADIMDALLNGRSIVKRRKLSLMSQYLAGGANDQRANNDAGDK